MGNGAVAPKVRVIVELPSRRVKSHPLCVCRGIFNFALREDIRNLCGAVAVHTKFENFPYHLGSVLIHNPVMLVIGVLEVAVGRLGTQRFTGLALCFEHRTDFLAGVLSVPFIDNIKERGKITVLLVCTVHTVVDGYEADISAGQNHLGVVAYFEVVSAQSAHILNDNRSDLTFVHQGHKPLPIRSVKVRTAVAIVYEELCVAEAVVICVFLQNGFLVYDGVAVSL